MSFIYFTYFLTLKGGPNADECEGSEDEVVNLDGASADSEGTRFLKLL